MKNYSVRFLFISALLIFLSTGCLQAKEEPNEKQSIVAQVAGDSNLKLAPDFRLQDLKQGTVTLSSYEGNQPVILFFWTTWCPYCRQELKKLNSLYPQLAKDGWELLAINIQEPSYRVENFTQSFNLSFKVLLDKEAAVSGSYGIFGVPTYVFINKQGYISLEEHFFPEEKYKKLILQ